MNQPVENAIKEQEEWESKGYLVTESYGNEWDMGNILELPEEGNGVMERHKNHMQRCLSQSEWRKRFL
jgi:hypothetical protein